MKKALIILLILGGIVLIAVVLFVIFRPENKEADTKEVKETVKWKVYENSRYQFSLNYPSDWQLGEEPTNNDGISLDSPDGKIECRAYGFNNALTNDQGGPQSLNEYIDWLTGLGGIQVLNRKQTKLSSYDAIQLITQEKDLVTEAIYALGKGSGRALECTFNNTQAQQDFSPTFEEIALSFQIKVELDGQGGG